MAYSFQISLQIMTSMVLAVTLPGTSSLENIRAPRLPETPAPGESSSKELSTIYIMTTLSPTTTVPSIETAESTEIERTHLITITSTDQSSTGATSPSTPDLTPSDTMATEDTVISTTENPTKTTAEPFTKYEGTAAATTSTTIGAPDTSHPSMVTTNGTTEVVTPKESTTRVMWTHAPTMKGTTTPYPVYGEIPPDEEATYSSPAERIYLYDMGVNVTNPDAYGNQDTFIKDLEKIICTAYKDVHPEHYLDCIITIINDEGAGAKAKVATESVPRDVWVEYNVTFDAHGVDDSAEDLYSATGISEEVANGTLSDNFTVTQEPCDGSSLCDALDVDWCEYATCNDTSWELHETEDTCMCESKCKHQYCESVHEDALCEHTAEGELICWCPTSYESYDVVRCESVMHKSIFILVFVFGIVAIIFIAMLICLWCRQKSLTKQMSTDRALDPSERDLQMDMESLADTWIKTVRSKDFDDIWNEAYEQGWDSTDFRPPPSESDSSGTLKDDADTTKSKRGDKGDATQKQSEDEDDWTVFHRPQDTSDRGSQEIGFDVYSNVNEYSGVPDMVELENKRPTSSLYESLPGDNPHENYFHL